ncbi:MAG: hypothetical protein GXX78_02585 [Bacteroidales bacterium]|nr:hypothetical protein [Bacteroidales bacterium]
MNKKIFFAVGLLLMAHAAFPQKVESSIPRHNYLGVGFGMGKISVFDQINMGVPYSGLNFGTDFDATFTFKKSYLQISNVLLSGNLTPYKSESVKKNSISNYSENFSIAHYWKVYSIQPSDIYFFAGPMLSAKGDVRINNGEVGNSALGYNLAGSVGLALKSAWYFNVLPAGEDQMKDFRLEGSLSMPLLAKVFTPTYIGITEKAVTESAGIIDLSSNYSGYPTNYFNLKVGLSLTYFLPNKNAVMLSYSRDYLKAKPVHHPVNSVNQFLSIKLLFNLK